jgi:hypothetical protein
MQKSLENLFDIIIWFPALKLGSAVCLNGTKLLGIFFPNLNCRNLNKIQFLLPK